jgi:sugar/nucleoside kinase (ribokinase family)
MKVLGIGNALVDIMVQLPDDNFLHTHQLPKGSMQLVDKKRSDSILQTTLSFPKRIASGGSSANTINGLARLGVQTGFIGSLGEDEMGKHFLSDFEQNNVQAHISLSNNVSGTALALVSHDGERTFATHLGASIEVGAKDIDAHVLSLYDIVHIEGYLLQNYELIETAVHVSKQNNLKVSLDLASFNVVEEHIEFLKKLLPGNIDFLFANEEEAKALTGLNPQEAVIAMGKYAPISVVKIGSKGSYIYDGKETHHIDAIDSICIDTTGAGDLYASGFLYGYVQNKDLKTCGRYGSILAGHVIRVIGAKIEKEQWNSIISLL